MDITQIGNYLDILFKIFIAVFSIYLFFDRREDKTNSRIDEHCERLVKIEAQLMQQPTHSDLAEVYKSIRAVSSELASINSSLSALGATMDAVREQTRRMDSYLLHNQSR